MTISTTQRIVGAVPGGGRTIALELADDTRETVDVDRICSKGRVIALIAADDEDVRSTVLRPSARNCVRGRDARHRA